VLWEAARIRYHVLATDYDGTLAHHGRVDDATLEALVELRRSGRKLLLVTGRVLEDLATVFDRLDLFDSVVAENGAVIHRPATQQTRLLAEPPPERFVAQLRERGVAPLGVGHVIVSTWHPHEDVVLDAIRACGLELQVIFNKGAVMVLPSGVNKATGLAAALEELKLSPHNAVGVGDAENDHAFLSACECSVAVANALDAVKERAHWVTERDHGAGVRELVQALEEDLSAVESCVERTALPIGTQRDGTTLAVPAHGPPVLIAGASGSGKSTLATRFLEELSERAYQFCVVDPEGDYAELAGATVLGDREHPPRAEQALELLDVPTQSGVLNLLGIPLADRPAFFDSLLPRLQELRAKTGRPHWIVADEAHHLLPIEWKRGALTRPEPLTNLLLITVHPERISPELLGSVGLGLGVGGGAEETLRRFADAIGAAAPARPAEPLREGESLAWRRSQPGAFVPFEATLPRGERRRHVRKYAIGELGPDKSFFFRGPEQKLNLRARNLQTFLDIADGVDDETWRHHLDLGDYSRWFRESIKDEELAADAERVERDGGRSPADSRAAIRAAVERRYTSPA
jgi:hydroxymethylpyrimidine pyrophosphatase-like HAD family hydrolase